MHSPFMPNTNRNKPLNSDELGGKCNVDVAEVASLG